jgi:hypothetical protein
MWTEFGTAIPPVPQGRRVKRFSEESGGHRYHFWTNEANKALPYLQLQKWRNQFGRRGSRYIGSVVTTEERFERIERVTAGLAAERRKYREEFRSLWRDTQRHIDEVAVNLSKLTVQVAEMDGRLSARIEAWGEESRAADRRLSERIESLVSAMGEFVASQTRKQS